jgi:hypothetical protein
MLPSSGSMAAGLQRIHFSAHRYRHAGFGNAPLAFATAAVALAPMPGHARRLVIARRTG